MFESVLNTRLNVRKSLNKHISSVKSLGIGDRKTAPQNHPPEDCSPTDSPLG